MIVGFGMESQDRIIGFLGNQGSAEARGLMRTNDASLLASLGVLCLTFGLFCLWLILSVMGLAYPYEVRIYGWLPQWLVVLNLLLGPCLMAATAGPWRIAWSTRVFCATLMLCSIFILEVSFKRYLIASCLVLTLLLIEAYWLIPKWNARNWRQRTMIHH
jgi:hypothetical protein